MEVTGGVALGCTEGPIDSVPPNAVVPEPLPAFRTVGCSGAAGFLRCAVTKTAAATVAPIVMAVATALSNNSRMDQTATGAFKNGTRS